MDYSLGKLANKIYDFCSNSGIYVVQLLHKMSFNVLPLIQTY